MALKKVGDKRKDHKGLSPSSMALYQSCARKYWHKKVYKTEEDKGAEQNTEALDIGKAFHQVLEDFNHDLTGLKYGMVVKIAKDNGCESHASLVFAMLSKYKKMFEKLNMTVLDVEFEIETDTFYGFVDVVLLDENGLWWIADMKTAASYPKSMEATLSRHVQLNLYAAHAYIIAEKLDLALCDFAGIKLLLTTKSKLKKKATESLKDVLERLNMAVDSHCFSVNKEDMAINDIKAQHLSIHKAIGLRKKPSSSFNCNFNSCFQWYRPCEYFSQCHGKEYHE